MVNIWILNWTYLDFLLIGFFQKRSGANSGAVNCWNYLSTQFIAVSLFLSAASADGSDETGSDAGFYSTLLKTWCLSGTLLGTEWEPTLYLNILNLKTTILLHQETRTASTELQTPSPSLSLWDFSRLSSFIWHFISAHLFTLCIRVHPPLKRQTQPISLTDHWKRCWDVRCLTQKNLKSSQSWLKTNNDGFNFDPKSESKPRGRYTTLSPQRFCTGITMSCNPQICFWELIIISEIIHWPTRLLSTKNKHGRRNKNTNVVIFLLWKVSAAESRFAEKARRSDRRRLTDAKKHSTKIWKGERGRGGIRGEAEGECVLRMFARVSPTSSVTHQAAVCQSLLVHFCEFICKRFSNQRHFSALCQLSLSRF